MPREINVDDQDPDIFGEPTEADTELRAAVEKQFAEEEKEGEDTDGLDAPLDTEVDLRETVSAEDGANMVSDARLKDHKAKKPAKDPDDSEDVPPKETAAPADEDKPGEGEGKDVEADKPGEGEGKDSSADDFDAVLAALPEAQKAAVTAKIKSFEDAFAPLREGRNAELMKMHGATPADAVKSLAQLNEYALTNPHEYLAWFTRDVLGEDGPKMLGQAAELLGYDLVQKQAANPDPDPAEDDDDPFADPKLIEANKIIRELRAKDAEREKQKPPVPLGPNAPHHALQRDYAAFVGAKDDKGNLLRPNWERYKNTVIEMAKAHAAETGAVPTWDDFGVFYDRATGKQNSPAPTPPDVQKQVQDVKKRAQKAKHASASQDGIGAGRSSQEFTVPSGQSAADTVRAVMQRLNGQ